MTTPSPSVNFPNVFHNDKWQLNFSNLPSLGALRDMKLYDNYIKSVVFPDYNMQEIYSDMMGFRVRHPEAGVRANFDLSQLQIEFKLSEDMKNYINLFEWMQALKYGQVSNFNTDEEFFRKNTIKSINLNILDNQKRPIAVWSFTECFLSTLGSLSLDMGVSDEVTFTANFTYEEIKFKTKATTGTCSY